jgi:hypothetical protein
MTTNAQGAKTGKPGSGLITAGWLIAVVSIVLGFTIAAYGGGGGILIGGALAGGFLLLIGIMLRIAGNQHP